MLAEETVQKSEVVEIRRLFPVDCEALFRAWTDPDALRSWFGPEGVQTELVDVDLCVGGTYRIEMRMPSGGVVVHHGTYEEIIRPQKLVFTWLLEDQECEGGVGEDVVTRVTVRFSRVESGTTELHLLHEGLPTQKARDGHEFGWNGCFECLGRFVAPRTTGE